jgi:hypothetical protein
MHNEKLLFGFTIITMVVMSLLFLRPPFTVEKVVISLVTLALTLRLIYNLWRAGKNRKDEDPDCDGQ